MIVSSQAESSDTCNETTSCSSHEDQPIMASKSQRMAYFLGEIRREKNGAVADFMRFYGGRYGLNYGVSLPTVRSLARQEAERGESLKNHKFSKLLYQQEVRELRLAALWMADIEQITSSNELDFWAQGIINSEVAEEAAFALLYRSQLVDSWLNEESVLLQYCAVMSMAKRCDKSVSAMSDLLETYSIKLKQLVENEPHILPKAVVVLLDSAIKIGVDTEIISRFVDSISADCSAASYIRDEIAWRLEFR